MAGKVVYTDLGLGAIVKEAQKLRNMSLAIGVVGEPARAPHGDSGLTNGEIAVIQHFGTEDGHIPPRHFVSLPLYRNNAYIVEQMEMVARKIINKESGPRAFSVAGERISKLIKSGLLDGSTTEPKLSPNTRPGTPNIKALIDSTQLYEAIGYEIVSGTSMGESIQTNVGDEGGDE